VTLATARSRLGHMDGCHNGSMRVSAATDRHEDLLPAAIDGAVFTFRDVSVVFGGTHIIDALDLDVPGTGITVVLGPSGSGKSTLTRLCDRLIDPTTGTVSLRGTDVRQLDVLALRRAVGMVFQRPTLFNGTVRDNLAATGRSDDGAYPEVLGAVGLDSGLIDRTAATLSGGEAQRVCLARALRMRPQVLVADEPTSSLDHEATLTLEALARDLADAGVPILWVTHDLAQVERIADQRVRLERGRLVPE
jgi:putative ABC transport system ATP-binding protein